MKKKNTIRIIASLCICLAVLWVIEALLMPKYMSESKEGALIKEYYSEYGSNDVIFIGDCEVYENFSPAELYNSHGITSYIRGSAQQLIWQSYYLMEETFKYETPKIMVFNVLSMKYDTPESTGSQSHREAYNRMNLDGMRWSSSKWNSIKASLTKEEKEWDGMWSYIFPILRYHDRWSQLTTEDFKYIFKRDKVAHNGYLMQAGIKPVESEHKEKPIANYNFSDNCWQYLDKMRNLCEKHGTELVLIKAPSLSPVWWDKWDEQIEDYAKKNDLLYINFLEFQEEIGIDWNTDTYDTGLHLNVYGAEKLSRYFGEILKENFEFEDHRNDIELNKIWEEKTKKYNDQKTKLENERDKK